MATETKIQKEFRTIPPTTEIRTKIEKHRGFLIQRVDPDHGLLDGFTASDPEIIEIKHKPGPIHRSEQILEYILKKNRCEEFLYALKTSKQTHVANFILGNGEYRMEYDGDWPLTKREIGLLDDHHKELIDEIDTESGLLLDRLFSKEVLNTRQKAKINSGPTRHEKVEVLLEILRRCNLNDYRLTMQCLHESNQSHVAKILEQGKDKMIDEVFKQIQNDLEKVEICLAEGYSKRSKLKDKKTNLLAIEENTKGEIIKRATELKNLIDMQMKSVLENVYVSMEENLMELENQDQENNELLTSLERLKTDFNELKSRKTSDDTNQSAKEAHTRTDDLEKLQKTLLQRQIPSVRMSFKYCNVEEFENIVGEIKVQPVIEMQVIVVGLSDDDGNVTNEVLEFNLNRPNEISYLPSVPIKIHPYSVAVTYDDKLFAIGIGKTSNEIWKFERNSGWKECANLHKGRLRHCATIVDNSVYIYGGWDSYKCRRWKSEEVLKSVESYNVQTNKCSTVGELVHAVDSSACIAYKGLIYVFGGCFQGGTYSDCVQIYNTRDNRCSLFSKPMPSPQSCLRALSWNNSVIILNRWTCFILDFETENWREREQFKTDVVYFGLVHDEGNVFVFGGGINERKDADGDWLWKCTDEVRWVRLIDIINGNMIEWKKLGRLPKPALIHAYT